MAFVSISNIAVEKSGRTTSRGRKLLRNGDSLLFSSTTPGAKTKNRGAQIAFTISEGLLKKARIIVGDRVDVLFDERDRTGLIKRVNSGGYAVSIRGSKAKPSAGLQTKMTWYEGMPFIEKAAEAESVVINEEGILFVFPKEAIFDRKA